MSEVPLPQRPPAMDASVRSRSDNGNELPPSRGGRGVALGADCTAFRRPGVASSLVTEVEAVPQPKKRRGLMVVTVLVAAAFGPYVAAGVRTEQALVYGVAVVVLLLTLGRIRPPSALGAVFAAWFLYAALALIGAVAPPFNASGYVPGDPVAGLDNAFLPLAVMVVVSALIALGGSPRALLGRAAAMLVLFTCINAGAALAQLRTGAEFPLWYGGAVGEDSVSVLAAQLGRYSGLINQPAEAGIIYSIAGFCALYRFGARPFILAATMVLIVVGGVLTVSKVFLLGGLPLIALALLRQRHGRAGRIAALAMVTLGAAAGISAGYLPQWRGLDFALRLLPGASNEDALTLFTASRYQSGGGGTLAGVTDAVLSGPWAFGFGAGGLVVPYDSAWVEALVVVGTAGVALQAFVLAVLARAWKGAPPSGERTLFGYVLVLLAGASIGLPALTANRVATVVWLILSLVLFACACRARDELRTAATGADVAGSDVERVASGPGERGGRADRRRLASRASHWDAHREPSAASGQLDRERVLLSGAGVDGLGRRVNEAEVVERPNG